MAKTVIWNKTASRQLDELLTYLHEEVSERAASRFLEKLYDRLDMLTRYPEAGRKSQKRKTVRFYRIDKHRQLYYRIHGRNLFVVFIFDTRQHPDKNRY